MAIPFEAVVADHGDAVYGVCRAILGPDEAEDAWSETFLAALRAYPDLEPGAHVRGWLVTIAHNKALDAYRSRARRRRASTTLVDVASSEVDLDGFDPLLAAGVRALPDKQRSAVVYRYLADLDYGEIARLLDNSEAAARRCTADGIAALRAHVAKEAEHG